MGQLAPGANLIRQEVERLHCEALSLESNLLEKYRAIGQILENAVAQKQITNFRSFVENELTIGKSCAYQCRKIYTEWDTINKLVGVSRIGPAMALRALGRYTELDDEAKPNLRIANAPKVYAVGSFVRVNNPTLPINGQIAEVTAQEKLLHFVRVEGDQHRYPLFPNELDAVDIGAVTVLQPRKRKSRLKQELAEIINQWRGQLPQPLLERLQELIN